MRNVIARLLARVCFRGDRWVLLFASGLLLSACTVPQATTLASNDQSLAEVTEWQSTLYKEHPLVGRIWHSHSNRFVDVETLEEALADGRFLLFGEKHDNPDHHRIQRNLLQFLFVTDAVGSVSFEMMDSDFDDRLAALNIGQFDSTEQLRDYLEWDTDGWDWSFYGPLISDVLTAGINIRPANINSTQVGEIYGQADYPEVAGVLDPAAMDQLNREIDESHCGMLPSSQFPAMVRVQQARDFRMASSLVETETADAKHILIAGNYHVRKDLGVPRYLQAVRPDTGRGDVVSIGLLEVNPESENPMDYLQAFSDQLPFDFVWFTPAVSDEDYCASMAR